MDRDCIQPFIVYVYAARCTTVRALTLTGYTSHWRHVTRDMHAQSGVFVADTLSVRLFRGKFDMVAKDGLRGGQEQSSAGEQLTLA